MIQVKTKAWKILGLALISLPFVAGVVISAATGYYAMAFGLGFMFLSFASVGAGVVALMKDLL